jgi:hypothetical protein
LERRLEIAIAKLTVELFRGSRNYALSRQEHIRQIAKRKFQCDAGTQAQHGRFGTLAKATQKSCLLP